MHSRGLRIAYLINYYPALSHTFIRREVAALRDLGVDPFLISIRRFPGELPDPRDVIDQARTRVVLGKSYLRLGWAAVRLLVIRPLLTLTVLGRTIRQYRHAGIAVVKPLAYFAEACVVRSLLERHAIEHLHVHMGTNAAAVAQIVRWLKGPGYTLTLHGPEEFDNPERLCLREKLRDARFVVCVSQGRCDELQAAFPEARAKIHLVRCGVDHGFGSAERRRRGVPDVASFVSVGRLCARKNHAQLISAVDQVRKVRPDVQLDIVGDGELFGQLNDQIQRLGLAKHVRLRGAAPSDAVAHYLAEARALVLPSLSETLPCVVMEAFAMQRPVICTHVGSLTELVEHGKSGWVIADNSVDAIAAAMMEALDTPVQRLDEMGACGGRTVAELHDSERQAVELLRLFDQHLPFAGRVTELRPRTADTHPVARQPSS